MHRVAGSGPRSGAALLDPLLLPIPAPAVPGTQALFQLWRAAKGDGADDLPDRDEFSIETLKRIGVLGHEFIIEPIEGGRDWRYRLVGADIVWMFGHDPTGTPFTQHFVPFEAEKCIAFSNQVARSRQPVFLRARFVSEGHSASLLETMSLPVWSRGRKEIWLIGASFPVEWE